MKVKKKNFIFFLAAFLFFGVVLVRQQFIMYNLNKQYKELANKLKDVNMQSVQLSGDIDESKRDDYMKMLASEKLRLIKPGELLFIDKTRVKNYQGNN